MLRFAPSSVPELQCLSERDLSKITDILEEVSSNLWTPLKFASQCPAKIRCMAFFRASMHS